LLSNQLEFFFVFVRTNIIHFSQLVELSQSQTSFTQIAKLRLTIVVLQVLICFRLFVPEFVEYHNNIIYAAGAAPPGAAGNAAPGVVAGAPAGAGSIPAISSPV